VSTLRETGIPTQRLRAAAPRTSTELRAEEPFGAISTATQRAGVPDQLGGLHALAAGWCGHILLPTRQGRLVPVPQPVGRVVSSGRQASHGRCFGAKTIAV
jgi:hypothetical protein